MCVIQKLYPKKLILLCLEPDITLMPIGSEIWWRANYQNVQCELVTFKFEVGVKPANQIPPKYISYIDLSYWSMDFDFHGPRQDDIAI